MLSKEVRQMRVEEIPPYLINIKNLNLTLSGIIDLSCFPEVVIKHADNRMAGRAMDNPFPYFCGIANRYCKEKGIRPNYTYRDQMKRKFNIEESAPKMLFLLRSKSYGGQVEQNTSTGRKIDFKQEEESYSFEGRDGSDRSYWEILPDGRKARRIDPERQLDRKEEYLKFEDAKRNSKERRDSIRKMNKPATFNPFAEEDTMQVIEIFKDKK